MRRKCLPLRAAATRLMICRFPQAWATSHARVTITGEATNRLCEPSLPHWPTKAARGNKPYPSYGGAGTFGPEEESARVALTKVNFPGLQAPAGDIVGT
jgi:hypothetical protein